MFFKRSNLLIIDREHWERLSDEQRHLVLRTEEKTLEISFPPNKPPVVTPRVRDEFPLPTIVKESAAEERGCRWSILVLRGDARAAGIPREPFTAPLMGEAVPPRLTSDCPIRHAERGRVRGWPSPCRWEGGPPTPSHHPFIKQARRWPRPAGRLTAP
jgi:hypothetical protein